MHDYKHLSPTGFANQNKDILSPNMRLKGLKHGSQFPQSGTFDNTLNDRLDEAIDETEKNRSPNLSPKSLYQRTEDFLRAVQ